MHKEGQVYKIKPEQEQPGLPLEVTLTKVDLSTGSATLSSSEGTYESTIEVLETFYVLKEEFTLENMPKMTISALDEIVSLFEIFAASQSPLAGLQVKAKILALQENISKVAGIKQETPSLLGKKIA